MTRGVKGQEGLGILEERWVEGGFRAAAAVSSDDVTDHLLPSGTWWRGGVTLQPPSMAAVDQSLSDQETQRPLADHAPVDQWDDHTELAGGVAVETDPVESRF